MPKVTHPKKRAFLAAYEETCKIGAAAEASSIPRRTHYAWMENDEAYRAEFERVRAMIGDRLEDEAIRRAHDGIEKPVTIAGQRELVREYSDTLLIFMLKGVKPEKYRERFEHTGAGGRPLLDLATARALMEAD